MSKKHKQKVIIIGFLFMIQLFSTLYILYALSLLSGIETLIRVLLAISLILIFLISVINYLKSIKKKKSKYYIYIPIILIYSLVLFVFGYYIHKTYSAVHRLSTNSTVYSSSLVTLSSNKATSIDHLEGTIGMVSDDTNMIGYTIPKKVIESEKLTNKIKEYDSYVDIINALYEKEIDFAFLPTNYMVMFETMEEADFSDIRKETKIIYTKEESVKNNVTQKSTTITEPFTILLMGVDSETENIQTSSFNGDSLILITFNPNTLSTTFLSIPRDSYVPITCFAGQRKNKITHAAWYGEECMMDTISNFTGIDIDYYVKINFKGVVKMVDTLGGVEVDVPYSFCEQDSNRLFGNNTIYVREGLQTLNGEQALAFARNRHPWPEYCGAEWSNYVSNDFIRGQNQQTVIRSLLNKIQDVKSLDTIYDLLDAIGMSMETNMTTNEILSFYNIAKDILVNGNGMNMDELLSIQRLYLSGYDKYIYDPGTKLNLYNYILYDGSVADVSEAMRVNLGEVTPELTKDFSFTIDEEYEETVIGKGNYSVSTVEGVMPDFVGDSEAQARQTAKRIGLSVTFTYKEVKGGDNTVISQSYPEGTSLSSIRKATLTIGTPMKEEENSKTNDDKEESEMVELGYLTNKTVSEAEAVCKKLGLTLKVRNDNYKQTDIIISQESVGEVKAGTIVYVRVKEANSSTETSKDNEDNETSESGNETDSDTSDDETLEIDEKIKEE